MTAAVMKIGIPIEDITAVKVRNENRNSCNVTIYLKTGENCEAWTRIRELLGMSETEESSEKGDCSPATSKGKRQCGNI